MEQKIAVVTGAGRGIGFSICETLTKSGYHVMMVSSSTQIFTAAKVLSDKGYLVTPYQVNVGNRVDVEAFFEDLSDKYGRIDVLVNNAGTTKDSLIVRMSEEDWDTVMDVNLKGTFLFSKYAGKIMMKQKSGKMINVSSVVGVIGNAGQANYVASKAGVIGLTKSLAKEFASRGITCNAIAPGFIETQMTENLNEKLKENYLTSIPLKRFGTPQDVANAVMFFASPSADYITGQVLHIDGGLVV